VTHFGSKLINEPVDPPPLASLAVDTAAWELIEDPIWVFDLDHYRVVWANAAGLELWRSEALEELQSRDMSDLSDIAKALLGEYADGFALNKSFEATWTLHPRNAEVRVRYRCCGVSATDGRTLMLVHCIGVEGRNSRVTERLDRSDELIEVREQLAHAEARYRAFAEAGSDWLWETDQDQKFVYYSSKVANHWAYSFDDVLGITRSELMEKIGADPDTEEVREKWLQHAAILDQQLPFRDLEYAYDRGTGEIAHASVSGDPIFSKTQEFLGYRGVGRDITRRVRAEEHGREMQRERDVAVTANSVTNQFLATMSHELRTPLNAILGFSEVMIDQLFGPMQNSKYHEYATDIFDSASHLLSIVEDLLKVSRLDISDANLDLEPILARQFVADIVRMTRSLATGRDLHLSNDIPDSQFVFQADQRALRQVMFNLISNAIKFTDRDGQIEICCRRGVDGATEIVVRDNGCGIRDVDLPHIFEPFHTVDPRVAKKQPGTGLGLWVCKRIVEAHHGQIYIESELGKGTTVTVRLPEGEVRKIERHGEVA